MNLDVKILGSVPYKEALELQYELLEKRQNGEIGDTLLLLEHPPVLTMGRRTPESHILAARNWLEKEGVSVEPINRGGDVTYHGPGQLVGYAFINLVNSADALRLFKEFNGRRWTCFRSGKVCAITYARIQGKQAWLHEQYWPRSDGFPAQAGSVLFASVVQVQPMHGEHGRVGDLAPGPAQRHGADHPLLDEGKRLHRPHDGRRPLPRRR